MKHARFSLVVLAAALLAAAGCDSGNAVVATGQGQVQLVVSAAAQPMAATTTLSGGDAPRLRSAYVTFSDIVARSIEGQFVDLDAPFPASVDILQVAAGREISLPAGVLPPGTYDQLVVVISGVELLTENGTSIVVTPPGGGWTRIVRVQEPFVVVEGQATTVILRIHWWSAFRWMQDHFEFDPTFECTRG